MNYLLSTLNTLSKFISYSKSKVLFSKAYLCSTFRGSSFTSIFHQIGFIFCFTNRNVSLGYFFIELSVAELALSSVVIGLLRSRHLLARIEITTSIFIWSTYHHRLSKLQALLLPLRQLTCRFRLSCWLGWCLFLLFAERFRVLVGWFNLIEPLRFSLIFRIECFPFLYKHLLTYFLVLLNGNSVKLPSASRTFNSRSIIFLHLL